MKINEEEKRILKLKKPVTCECKRQKSRMKERAKYGICSCDTYTFHYSVGLILANALYQYIVDSGHLIKEREKGWNKKIEWVATAIKEYSTADSWDEISDSSDTRYNYRKKEKDFREAMFWLSEHWQYLWW